MVDFYKKINLYYNNDNYVDYAILEYTTRYENGRIVEKKRYIPRDKINSEMEKIVNIFNQSFSALEQAGIISYVKRDILTKEEKDYHKRLKNDSIESRINMPSSLDVTMLVNNVVNKLKSKGIKMKAYFLAGLIAIGGAGYAIKNAPSSNEKAKQRGINTAQMLVNGDYNSINSGDINNLLNFTTGFGRGENSSFNSNLSDDILRCLQYDNEYAKNVVERFEKLYRLARYGGESNKGDLLTYNFCMYGTSLIMGGDRFIAEVSTSLVLPKMLELQDEYARLRAVDGYCERYGVSRNRVQYSAVSGEASLYTNLPPIAKMIMLNQLSEIVNNTNFEFRKEDCPTWWAGLQIENSYNHDKLVEEIESQKEACKEEVYNTYTNSSKKI